MEKFEKKNRIAEALSFRGWEQVDLAEKTGIKKASINSWVKQRWQPKQKSLVKMAMVLEVSEIWLAGYDAPMERPISQVKMDELAQLFNVIRKDDKLRTLIVNISKLNSDQLNAVEHIVNTFTNQTEQGDSE